MRVYRVKDSVQEVSYSGWSSIRCMDYLFGMIFFEEEVKKCSTNILFGAIDVPSRCKECKKSCGDQTTRIVWTLDYKDYEVFDTNNPKDMYKLLRKVREAV